VATLKKLTTRNTMATPKRADSRVQLACWVEKDVKAALVALAQLSGLSVTACLEALVREAAKKAGI
jgi:hypothetical protein